MFEDVCCIGLSTHTVLPLQNYSNTWLHIRLSVCMLTIDGRHVDPTIVIPFVMKDRLTLEPYSTEELKVSLQLIDLLS